jgi:polysaccharide deacetylase 2 family uncharacterized protein YibQ
LSEEITLELAPEALDAWRTDPATEKVMEFLTKVRQSSRLALINMPSQSFTAEKIALEMVRVQGYDDGISEIINLRGGQANEE